MARILHIEDDSANRLLVRKLLTPAGFEVVDAADGVEGIRKALSDQPDLVLVDIAVPGLDGYEVTLRLRAEAHLKHVPIVAITAEGNRETSLAVGCDGFLQKPIDARTFADTIRGYLLGFKDKGDQTSKHLRLQSQRIVSHLEEKLAQLSEANARLVEMDNARREFYRNVSHELATPMTPIVGYVKLLLDNELGDLNVAQSKALRAINDCADRLRGLIDNLLDVTAIETGRMRFKYDEYDLVPVAQQALSRAEAKFAEKKITVLSEIHRPSMPGFGDASRLGRALDQLLDNAAKFTPIGGSVGLRVGVPSDRHYELCVADTGPGVPPEASKRVFEPFFQADGSETRSYGGAGVGLAVVRGVARGHAGYAAVKSPADERIGEVVLSGAAFTLMLAQRVNMVSE
jgi:signal transduction histidine kinase